jgi:hypothetical protein
MFIEDFLIFTSFAILLVLSPHVLALALQLKSSFACPVLGVYDAKDLGNHKLIFSQKN